MVEFEDIMVSYEFEDRGNLFMVEVIKLSEDFPSLIVEAENKTIRDLETNSWAIEKSAKLNREEMNRKAFLRGFEMDIKSATESSVMITIHGTQKRIVEEFEEEVYKSAQHFRGIRASDSGLKDFDGPEESFKFFTCATYIFR